MKCKITRHKEGVDEDGVVVTTLVTAIGNHQGADHVEGVLRSLETGGWKMDHRLCVFSVFGDTDWSPLGAARDEDARSYTTTMLSIDETARRVKPLVADSHREVTGSTLHTILCTICI